MIKQLDCTDEFNELVGNCESALFNQEKIEFYHKGCELEEMKKAFKQNIEQMNLLDSNTNIYALWSKSINGDWNLKYIEQRKRGSIKQRIREHLFYKNEKTGSQLKNIQKEIKNGNNIGVTVVAVFPDELRSAIEESLISKQDNKSLWNIHSSGK